MKFEKELALVNSYEYLERVLDEVSNRDGSDLVLRDLKFQVENMMNQIDGYIKYLQKA